jgi:hypothetical protein
MGHDGIKNNTMHKSNKADTEFGVLQVVEKNQKHFQSNAAGRVVQITTRMHL